MELGHSTFKGGDILFLNLLSILFSVTASFAATFFCFNSYYSESMVFTLVLCTIAAILTLCIIAPIKPRYRLILSFTGTLLVVNGVYNLIASVSSTLLTIVASWLIPVKKAKKRFLFTVDNTLVTIVEKRPSRFKSSLKNLSILTFISTTIIFALTFTLSFHQCLWACALFP